MIIPILQKVPGKVIAGPGLQSIQAGGKTLLAVTESRTQFRGAFYCSLIEGAKEGGVVRVGEGLVNGLMPFLGNKKLDDPAVETLKVKDFSKDGYAWVLVRVRTDDSGRMLAAKDKDGKYGRRDLEIVVGTRPRRSEPDGNEWIAEHAIAILRQPKGAAAGVVELRQIVYFDLQHSAALRDGRLRHFFGP